MASIKILLRNKPNKEGQYPVVLKIIKYRKIKVITLGISCLEKDWDKANAKFKKSQNNFMQRNRALLKKKEEALKIIDDFFLEGVDHFIVKQFYRPARFLNLQFADCIVVTRRLQLVLNEFLICVIVSY